jgi:hypothetical protein
LRRIEEFAPDTVTSTQVPVRINALNSTLPGVASKEVLGGETRVDDVLADSYRAVGTRVGLGGSRTGHVHCRAA